MATFSKKQRDLAMKIICDFYANSGPLESISDDYLKHHGIPENINVKQLIRVLEAMGYVSIKRYVNGPGTIHLTDAGKCYFERKADLSKEKRIEWARYIITTAIATAALITAIVSICLQYR